MGTKKDISSPQGAENGRLCVSAGRTEIYKLLEGFSVFGFSRKNKID
jgi:hypothetical protein